MGDDSTAYDRPSAGPRIAALPFVESPGVNSVASSSIWNIKSLVDCFDLRTGLPAIFAAVGAFAFDAD